MEIMRKEGKESETKKNFYCDIDANNGRYHDTTK